MVVGWAEEHGVEDPFAVALIVDELVTNAIVHGSASRVPVHLDVDGTRIKVAVDDPSATAPAPTAGPLLAEHGRGLLLVDALSTQWGWTDLPVGKRVWCVVGYR
jgi:anti-sigma regulatory factor (Ser/Thr protein kinase)